MNQFRLTQEFEGLYSPIVGASDPSTPRSYLSTDPALLARTNRLREEYEELRRELITEIGMVDQRMINPAMQAKDCLQPLKKTIKKRDDRKVRIRLGPASDNRRDSIWITDLPKHT
jgi:hypothetical protein